MGMEIGHTSELQSPCNLVCRLLLEKKKKKYKFSLHNLLNPIPTYPSSTTTHYFFSTFTFHFFLPIYYALSPCFSSSQRDFVTSVLVLRTCKSATALLHVKLLQIYSIKCIKLQPYFAPAFYNTFYTNESIVKGNCALYIVFVYIYIATVLTLC